jgi:hypothetical protein
MNFMRRAKHKGKLRKTEQNISHKSNWNAHNLLIFDRCILKNVEWIKLAYDGVQWRACN